jgi:hypothetical protein
MNYVIIGRVNACPGIFSRAVANLTRQNFGAPFLEYERPLIPRDPLAANLVESVSRYGHREPPRAAR